MVTIAIPIRNLFIAACGALILLLFSAVLPGPARAQSPEYTAIITLKTDGNGVNPIVSWMSGANGFLWEHVKQASGDFNGDGKQDQAALYDYGRGTTGIWLFLSDGTTNKTALAWKSQAGNFDWTKAKPMAGDFNGDGKDDIIVLYDYGNNTAGLWVFVSDGQNMVPKLAWKCQPGNFSWVLSKVVAGDSNGDGKQDVTALYDYGNSTTGIWTFVSNGTDFLPTLSWKSAPGNFAWQAVKPASGDINGDGKTDVAVLYNYGGNTTGIWTFLSNGKTHTPRLAWKSFPGNFSWTASQAIGGDFNGDRKSDLAILYNYGWNGMGLWSFQSDGNTLSPKLAWSSQPGEYNWDYSKPTFADQDGDGKGEVQVIYRGFYTSILQNLKLATEGQKDILTLYKIGVVAYEHTYAEDTKEIILRPKADIDLSILPALPDGMKFIKAISKTSGNELRIALNRGAFYKVSQTDDRIVLKVELPELKDKIIVLDPGHGGADPGAIGSGGTLEKDINLSLALKLQDLLTGLGAKVLMTRTTDKELVTGATTANELQARINVAVYNDADVFLSIHHNSSPTSSTTGSSVWISAENGNGSPEQSLLLANLLQNNLVDTLGTVNLGVKEAAFYVTRKNQICAALAEIGYLSNPAEEAVIKSDEFQAKAAEAMARALTLFFNSFQQTQEGQP